MTIKVENNVLCSVTQSCPTLCNPLGPQSARFLCPWNFPNKNTETGLPFLPPVELPNPGMETVSLASPTLAGRFFSTELPGEIM